MILSKISNEQSKIVKALKNNNVIVNAVAGSGKTTTSLHVANKYINQKILLLTYSKQLKIETKNKKESLNIGNLEVFSYHSFCKHHYDNSCHDDSILIKIIDENKKCIRSFRYDMIILDECQDMTKIYYGLINKIINDNKTKNTKICILGDIHQNIYKYKDGDERYITFGESLFKFNKFNWKKLGLNVSFRLTDKIAKFINKCMLNSNRIITTKKSEFKPRYIICNIFSPFYFNDEAYVPYKEILYYLSIGYKPNDIFVLAPSVKSQGTPIRKLDNYIGNYHKEILIYIPTSDEEKLDYDVIKNKLVLTTFHQSKGLERKVVIVLGFDFGYFRYFNKKCKDIFKCPNIMYVATTRATERLTLIHNKEKMYLPFLNKENIIKYCDFIDNGYKNDMTFNMNNKDYIEYKKELNDGNDDEEFSENNDEEIKPTHIPVTEIIRHLTIDVINKCYKKLTINHLNDPTNNIKIPKTINVNLGIENKENNTEIVSEINGIAIPAYYEYIKNKKSSILEICTNLKLIDIDNKSFKKFCHEHSEKIKEIIKNKEIKKNILYIATIYNCFMTGFTFKAHQINNFKWLSKDILKQCMQGIDENLTISSKSKFEYQLYINTNEPLKIHTFNKNFYYIIDGRCDCLDENNLYEFKCVEELKIEHYLQLALYMYLHKKIIMDDGVNNLHVGDKIKYYKNNIGYITKIFNNKKIEINSTYKISVENIKNNLTYEKTKLNKSHYFIYNIPTHQLDEIKCDFYILEEIIKFLIYKRYIENEKILSDDKFLEKTLKIHHKYDKYDK